MASSIDSITFIQMTGVKVPTLASAVEVIDRPGVDGYANRDNALKAEEIQVRTLEGINQLNDANDIADTYAALKGQRVTVVDDLGRSVEEVLVVDVRVLSVQTVLLSDPPDNNYLVRAVWLLKPTQ